MAIDTRSSTPAGGADERPKADDDARRPRPPSDSGTEDGSDRLVPEMTAPTATREDDARFEAVTLEDVKRVAAKYLSADKFVISIVKPGQ